jgi:hypothetical protein
MEEEVAEFFPGVNGMPLPGDAPLTRGDPGLYAAESWHARAWGFKRAADTLASDVLMARGEADLMIYPLVFLYRHQLELHLKDLILTGNELVDNPIKLKDHALDGLWKDCRNILEKIGIEVDIPETRHFEESLAVLNSVDRTSTAFRYPVTKSGAPTLPPDLAAIDAENLRNVMDRMDFFLGITTRRRAWKTFANSSMP